MPNTADHENNPDGGKYGENRPITVYTKDVVLWRDYVDARFADRDNHVNDRFEDALRAIEQAERLQVERVAAIRQEARLQHEATEQAIQVAQSANEKRFTSVEDLRSSLTRFMPRAEVDTLMNEIHIQLSDLAQLKANERLQVERVEGLRRETEALRLGSERAISKSEAATEKRFESVNEFRAQLSDQAARFMPRTEAEAAAARNSERSETLAKLVAAGQSRVDAEAAYSRINERYQELADRFNKFEAREAGSQVLPRIDALKAQLDSNSTAILTTAGVKQGGQESKSGLYAMFAAIAAIVVVVNIIIALATQ